MTVNELTKQNEDSLRSSLEQYFVDITSECPYGMPQHAVYHQAFLDQYLIPQWIFSFVTGIEGMEIVCIPCVALGVRSAFPSV